MYTYEIADILFLIKSIRNPASSFNINNYITFYTGANNKNNESWNSSPVECLTSGITF